MVQINNIDETIDALGKLQADTKPLWGGMTPQHMVEHLAMVTGASTGKMNLTQRTTPEEGEAAKKVFIYTDMEIKQGVKSPLIGDELPAYVHNSLKDAVNELKNELTHFENYYATNPEATHIQPRLGALTYAEWKIFHNKHFTHHFKQFNLI